MYKQVYTFSYFLTQIPFKIYNIIWLIILEKMAVSSMCCSDSQAWGIYHPPTFPTWLSSCDMCICKKEKKKLNKKKILLHEFL